MIQVVTGAFGYSGKYITARLLDKGVRVRTLTNSPSRNNPFGGTVEAFPLSFDDPARLATAMRGATVLYNTYWVRFNHRDFTFASAVRNTGALFAAAKEAGIERIVHVSITNPSEDSPFEYFRGKGALEKALRESGVSYAILRPAVLFGKEDILISNIAWMLRRFPVFGIFGDGEYRLQPIYVDDLAGLAVEQGEKRENVVVDAIGPETFTYRNLVAEVGRAIEIRRRVVSIPPALGLMAGWLVGKIVGDVVITREEIGGLMAGLLYVDAPPAGTTKLTEWARHHASTLGLHYASELRRRKDRRCEYMAE